MEKIRVLIADDYQLVRDGIQAMLEDQQQIEVTATAASGREILDQSERHEIDLVIMDINMPVTETLQTVKDLKEEHPDIKILGISGDAGHEIIRKMIRAGMTGYILKSSGMDDLLEAIRLVQKDMTYFKEETARAALGGGGRMASRRDREASNEEGKPIRGESLLTDREIEVLRLICDEFTNKEIAEMLGISVRTVDSHRRNLLQKTGARNTAGLVKYAIRLRLLKL